MITTLRAYFLERLLREKILLLAFLLFAVLWWASAASARAARFWREQQATTRALKEQDFWINNRPTIEKAAETAASQLDPSRTLDGLRLVAALNAAASEAGLRNVVTNIIGSESHGQFTIHTANFSAQGNPYSNYERFYKTIEARSPYMGIEVFGLASRQGATADALTLTLRVSSVEIAKR